MKARIGNAQDRFTEPHKKMMIRVQSATREKRLNAIKTFYNIAEPKKYDEISIETRQKIESSSDEDILKFCKELCTEAINRDFVSYVTKGVEGPVGKTVYASLL